MLYVQKYIEKFCKPHLHGQHLRDSKPDKKSVGDLQKKHPFQDEILVKPLMGA